MADLTSSQDLSKNVYSPYFSVGTMERWMLTILKRFRFCEIGKVVEIDASKMKVRCELVYRQKTGEGEENRITRWMPVHSIFASVNEGIAALPNVGDYGIVFFRLADICGEFFLSSSWGAKSLYPESHIPLEEKDLLIKRNGSWFLIDKSSDIEIFHKRQNQIFLSDGYIRVNSPETGYESNYYDIHSGIIYQQQKMSNQHINRLVGNEFRLAAFERNKTSSEQGGIPGETQTLSVTRIRVPTDIDGNVSYTGAPLDQSAFINYIAPLKLEVEVVNVKKTKTTTSYCTTFTMDRTTEIRLLSSGETIFPLSGKIVRTYVDHYVAIERVFTDEYGRNIYGLDAEKKQITSQGIEHYEVQLWGAKGRIKSFALSTLSDTDNVFACDPVQQEQIEKEYMRFEVDEFDNLKITDDIVGKTLGLISDSYSADDGYINDGESISYVQQDHEKLFSEKNS